MTGKIEQQRQRVGDFFEHLSHCTSQGEIFQSSIVIAYYLLFSIFPIVIIVGNVLPLFHIDTDPITEYLELMLPSDMIKYVIPIVQTLLKTQSTGYISFGAIVALWSMSSMVNAIRVGMNRLYGVHLEELQLGFWHFIWNRLLTIIFSALLVTLFTLLALAVIFGQQILSFFAPVFNYSMAPINRLFSYRWLILLVIMTVTVYYLNAIVPNVNMRKKAVMPGTITTVVGWEALAYLFAYYLGHFPVKWENYGIVGTFIIFMLWLNLLAVVLLFGTAVNAAIDEVKMGPAVYYNGFLAELLKRWRDNRHQSK